jgi:hypothetical protein
MSRDPDNISFTAAVNKVLLGQTSSLALDSPFPYYSVELDDTSSSLMIKPGNLLTKKSL